MQIVAKKFTIPEFQQYVDSIKMNDWFPSFVVVHNTSEPSQKMYKSWHDRANWTPEQWLRNLASYYSGMGWNGTPHLFVAYDYIMVLNPLDRQGTHSPSWNSVSWGVETVGEFEDEPFDNGVKNNLIAALAILHKKLNLKPETIRFHKEDPRTTHKECPGKNINKHQLIQDIISYINPNIDYHVHISEAAQIADNSALTDEELTSIKWVQEKLNVTADGVIGPQTRGAIKAFQATHNLTVDGIAGPVTRLAIKRNLL